MPGPAQRRLRALPVALLALLLAVFFFAPLLLFLSLSVATFVQPGEIDPAWTWENYARVFGEAYTVGIFATTLRVGLMVTGLCILIGYPVAHFVARETGWRRSLVLLIVTASLFTNLIVRTYGWIVLLTPRGVLNSAMIEAGLIERPVRLIFNQTGVVIGLTQIMLPIFILVAAVSIAAIPRTLEDAAEIAGAGPVRRFLRVTLPLSLPGVTGGGLLVFVLSVSNFITPDFLGGGRVLMVGSMIYQLVTRTLNYSFAAAVSVALLLAAAALALAVWTARRLVARVRRVAG